MCGAEVAVHLVDWWHVGELSWTWRAASTSSVSIFNSATSVGKVHHTSASAWGVWDGIACGAHTARGSNLASGKRWKHLTKWIYVYPTPSEPSLELTKLCAISSFRFSR